MRRPPRSNRTTHSFPTRRSSDLLPNLTWPSPATTTRPSLRTDRMVVPCQGAAWRESVESVIAYPSKAPAECKDRDRTIKHERGLDDATTAIALAIDSVRRGVRPSCRAPPAAFPPPPLPPPPPPCKQPPAPSTGKATGGGREGQEG